MCELTARLCMLSWGSMGEFDVSAYHVQNYQSVRVEIAALFFNLEALSSGLQV